jgi:protein involved in polysaccharide export with SLBB domain
MARKNGRLYEYRGRMMTIREACRLAGGVVSDPNDARNRVVYRGWTVERAVSTPVKRRPNEYVIQQPA